MSVYRTSTGARYAAFDDTAPACPKPPPPPPPSKYFDYIKTHTGPLIEAFEKHVQLCSQNNCHGHGRCNVIDNRTLDGGGCACFDGHSGQTCDKPESIQSAASKPAYQVICEYTNAVSLLHHLALQLTQRYCLQGIRGGHWAATPSATPILPTSI